jgi:hypothetical protein
MRRNSKIDRNQPEIVRALRQAGATVQSLCAVRDGVPDLLVGFRKQNYLMEIKDGNLPVSRRRLTDDEKAWGFAWLGQIAIVTSVEEAMEVIGL